MVVREQGREGQFLRVAQLNTPLIDQSASKEAAWLSRDASGASTFLSSPISSSRGQCIILCVLYVPRDAATTRSYNARARRAVGDSPGLQELANLTRPGVPATSAHRGGDPRLQFAAMNASQVLLAPGLRG